LNVPKLLELAFAELQFELLVKAVAEVWIDPTSREMLDLMVDRVRRMPVLLIVTFRPEFQHSWVGQPHVTLLALRLNDRHVATLVLGLAGSTPLSATTQLFA
jgi:predicted ATPase